MNILPIAMIDTLTYSETKRAVIQQYMRTDIINPCYVFQEEG